MILFYFSQHISRLWLRLSEPFSVIILCNNGNKQIIGWHLDGTMNGTIMDCQFKYDLMYRF
jgi:hypothetical protein